MKPGRTAVIVGAQWGDEGKGKIVDVLSENFSIVARYAGGHNAGHTVIIKGKKFVLQLVPCGVLRKGCRSVIGNGVVLDPIAFLNEVAMLRAAGVQVDGNLFVSNRAHVILPYHRMIEMGAENAPGRVKIGTTSRGIGPAYEDKMGRRGLRVADLLDSSLLRATIENAVRDHVLLADGVLECVPGAALTPARHCHQTPCIANTLTPPSKSRLSSRTLPCLITQQSQTANP